jgi:predicted Zn finger-like uncharacterized protein
MDIACPTCAATYEIDDGSVGEAGRKVRCAECATIWRVHRSGRIEFPLLAAPTPPLTEQAAPSTTVANLPEAPPLAPDEADLAPTADLPGPAGDLGEAEPAEPPAAPVPPPRGKARITAGTRPGKSAPSAALRSILSLKTLVLVAASVLLAGAFTMRERVVRFVPQTAAVFAAVGAPVNLRGIDIRDVKSRTVEDNGVNVLVVDGNLVNLRDQQVTVPRLRFAVIGDRGQEIFVWSAQADRTTLRPGEMLNFRRRLAAPPTDGKEVTVRFLSASDITAGLR